MGNLKTESVIIWYDNARPHTACGAQNAFLPNFPRIVTMSNHGIKHLFNVLYTMYTMKITSHAICDGVIGRFDALSPGKQLWSCQDAKFT